MLDSESGMLATIFELLELTKAKSPQSCMKNHEEHAILEAGDPRLFRPGGCSGLVGLRTQMQREPSQILP